MTLDVMTAKIVALSISSRRGIKKRNVDWALFIEDFGIQNDAHAGKDDRQVSLLSMESIEKIRFTGFDVNPGDFAENITTQGIDLLDLGIGDKLKMGNDVVLKISQIGKVCHAKCAIFQELGDCIMPREGIFAKVLNGGIVTKEDMIERL